MGTNYPALLLRAESRPTAWPTDYFYPSGFFNNLLGRDGAGAGRSALKGRSLSRFSKLFQAVEIMGPDVFAGAVKLGRLSEAAMLQPKMGPAGNGLKAKSDGRADPVVEVLEARRLWRGRIDAIPLHQLFRILHDVHQGVEAGGWKAELA